MYTQIHVNNEIPVSMTAVLAFLTLCWAAIVLLIVALLLFTAAMLLLAADVLLWAVSKVLFVFTAAKLLLAADILLFRAAFCGDNAACFSFSGVGRPYNQDFILNAWGFPGIQNILH